jgi:hypothetical protein
MLHELLQHACSGVYVEAIDRGVTPLRMVDKRLMFVSNSNVTQLIDKLERLGLVERVDSPTDRRLVLAA